MYLCTDLHLTNLLPSPSPSPSPSHPSLPPSLPHPFTSPLTPSLPPSLLPSLPPPLPLPLYKWQETKSGQKQKLSVCQYVDTAMSFVQKTMQDENIFPTKFGEWTRTRRSGFVHSLLDTQFSGTSLKMVDENPGKGSTMMLRSSSSP